MSNFVDRVKITCKAGNGGNGSVSFHREKFVTNGGPDGGDGGHGGDVYVFTDPNMHTLLDFRFKSKFTAQSGGDGAGGRCSGKRGESITIKVPPGTVFRDAETNLVVADMDTPGETRLLLKGGRGGWGNMHFATPTRQAPNFAKPGTKTEIHTFLLELKTIADVGLVGYPNVGKSTLLSVVTSAKPKIGNYHFTTLTPNLGIVRRHGEDIVLADIPGLVEGASEGVGLGHDFLRHVDRTRLLLHLVDISGSEGRDPIEDYDQINRELENYGDLASRPQILVLNKSDLCESTENVDRMKAHIASLGVSIPVFTISAATHQGLDPLLDCVEEKLRDLPPIQHYEPETVLLETKTTESFHIEMDGEVFVVVGSAMDHLLDSVNFDDDESINWFHRSLRRLGVIDALRDAGAGEGATVRIADIDFDFID
ncbi:MAG: GTPase ObgE [Clostridia bacterium]|nr:GTPase ObgE [Clostridia bacterium]